MKEIRLGTIGSGVIVHSFLDNVSRVEGIRLMAVYSRNEEKGLALKMQYGADKAYTDLDSFFSDPGIDAVYIASPNILHYGQIKKALNAGKHVICEKPFCTKAEHVKELSSLAKEKRLMMAEAMPTAFLPNLKAVREALPEIGRIRLVMANYSQYSSRYDDLLSGRLPNVFCPEFGGGCLMDINYYNIYLTAALFGRPKSFDLYPNMHENGIDTSGTVHMSYEGFQASLSGAKDTFGENYYQIEGEKGYIYIPGGSNGLKEVRVVTRETDETVNLQQDPDRLFYEVGALKDMLLSKAYGAFSGLIGTTFEAVSITEELRKKTGIIFPEEV